MTRLTIVPNPDKEKYLEMTQAVGDNNNHCPCLLERSSKTLCMCEEFREQTTPGLCHCQRFLKIKVEFKETET
jgi:hypothetical protein